MMSGLSKRPQGGIRESEGFTLVELIVTLAIVAICVGLIMSILLSGTTMTANQIEKDRNRDLTGYIMNFMKETIQYSSEEVVIDSGNPSSSSDQDYGWFFISNDGSTLSDQGYLYFKKEGVSDPPQNIFGQDFYNNKKIGISIIVVDDDTFQVTIKVYGSGGTVVHQMTDSISLTKKGFDPGMLGVSPTSGDFSPALILFK